MNYSEGSIGQVFYIRFNHGEDLISGIHSFVSEHAIKSGVIHLIGALSGGKIVTGPKKTNLPPDPISQFIDEGHEILGTDFIRTGDDGSRVHIHASAGRKDHVLTGCLRETAEVYLIIEAVIIEFSGFQITEQYDAQSELMLPVPTS